MTYIGKHRKQREHNMRITDPQFLKALAERSISTAAQTAVALIGTDAAGVLDLDWQETLAVVAGAFLLSVLKGVAAAGQGTGGPGFGTAESTEEQLPAYFDDEFDEDDLDDEFDPDVLLDEDETVQ